MSRQHQLQAGDSRLDMDDSIAELNGIIEQLGLSDGGKDDQAIRLQPGSEGGNNFIEGSQAGEDSRLLTKGETMVAGSEHWTGCKRQQKLKQLKKERIQFSFVGEPVSIRKLLTLPIDDTELSLNKDLAYSEPKIPLKSDGSKHNRPRQPSKQQPEKEQLKVLHLLTENEHTRVITFPSPSPDTSPPATSNNKILFFSTFTLDSGRELTLAQDSQLQVFIGQVSPRGSYSPLAVVPLPGVLTCLACIPHPRSATHSCGQALYLGCDNGRVYVVGAECLGEGPAGEQIQLGPDSVLDCTGGGAVQAVSHIVRAPTCANSVYVILAGQLVRVFAVQRRHQIEGSHDQCEAAFRWQQVEPSRPISLSKRILFIQPVRSPSRPELCLMILMQGMRMPCILTFSEAELWFPGRVDKLPQAYNLHLEESDEAPCFPTPNDSITALQFNLRVELASVGYSNGQVYLARLQPSPSAPTPLFKYLLALELGYQLGCTIKAMASLPWEPYLCIASDVKIVFYDMAGRRKWTPSFMQKPGAVVDVLGWTARGHQLWVSRAKGSAYFCCKELPITARLCDT